MTEAEREYNRRRRARYVHRQQAQGLCIQCPARAAHYTVTNWLGDTLESEVSSFCYHHMKANRYRSERNNEKRRMRAKGHRRGR